MSCNAACIAECPQRRHLYFSGVQKSASEQITVATVGLQQ